MPRKIAVDVCRKVGICKLSATAAETYAADNTIVGVVWLALVQAVAKAYRYGICRSGTATDSQRSVIAQIRTVEVCHAHKFVTARHFQRVPDGGTAVVCGIRRLKRRAARADRQLFADIYLRSFGGESRRRAKAGKRKTNAKQNGK